MTVPRNRFARPLSYEGHSYLQVRRANVELCVSPGRSDRWGGGGSFRVRRRKVARFIRPGSLQNEKALRTVELSQSVK